MKTKNFLLFSTTVFAVSIFLIVFHSQPPESFQSIVTQTHQHLKDFQENLHDVEESHLVEAAQYWRLLGLSEESAGLGPAWRGNTSQPALVTHARGKDPALAVSFVRAAARLPYTVLVYNLGLKPYSLAVLSNYCNSTKCAIIDFDLSEFPSHVSDESIHAFRPIIIQHALSLTGGVVYSESGWSWSSHAAALGALWSRAAAGGGVLAWPRRAAVTSLTHPRMFHYLKAAQDDFLFVQMLSAERLVLADNPRAKEVMKAWVQCALTVDCIMPIGAQSEGCRFDKKPQYRYSGCHGQDASALSIILGQRSGFEEGQYAVRSHSSAWRRTSPESARAALGALQAASARNGSDDARTDSATQTDTR